jgi:hypothetical protein
VNSNVKQSIKEKKIILKEGINKRIEKKTENKRK